MVFPGINKLQLFNLKEDPHETTDLAPRHPEQVERLKKLMLAQQKALGDKQPLSTDQPKEAEFKIPKTKAKPRHLVGGEARQQTTD